MNIYVGNLAASTNEEQVKSAFAEFGAVNSVKLIVDFETGRSRGFAFVDMSQNDGKKAIDGLNGAELDGRALVVNEAYERKRNNFGGGSSNGYGNNGGGRRNMNDGGRRY